MSSASAWSGTGFLDDADGNVLDLTGEMSGAWSCESQSQSSFQMRTVSLNGEVRDGLSRERAIWIVAVVVRTSWQIHEIVVLMLLRHHSYDR